MYHRLGFVPPSRVGSIRLLLRALDLTPGVEGFRATPFEATRDLLQPHLTDIFPGVWTYAIVVAVAPKGGVLTPHTDTKTSIVRKHLVVQTNADAWVYHNRDWQSLDEGWMYTMDPSQSHGAVNWGEQPRIHLAVDCD